MIYKPNNFEGSALPNAHIIKNMNVTAKPKLKANVSFFGFITEICFDEP
jgi:hypothetical protein